MGNRSARYAQKTFLLFKISELKNEKVLLLALRILLGSCYGTISKSEVIIYFSAYLRLVYPSFYLFYCKKGELALS